MTLGELLEAISVGRGRGPATVTGLEGIASIFGVSISTAKRIKASGLPALGGPDLQSTRLWWDVDVPNF